MSDPVADRNWYPSGDLAAIENYVGELTNGGTQPFPEDEGPNEMYAIVRSVIAELRNRAEGREPSRMGYPERSVMRRLEQHLEGPAPAIADAAEQLRDRDYRRALAMIARRFAQVIDHDISGQLPP